MLSWVVAAVLAVASADAGVLDAAPSTSTAPSTGGVIDFTDDEGLAGGEEMTTAPPEPIEHESLMPERFRRTVDAGPAPARPTEPRRRGCGGCSAAGAVGGGGWELFVALAWCGRRRRRGRVSSTVSHDRRRQSHPPGR